MQNKKDDNPLVGRLGSLDEKGHRNRIIPGEVKGFWRRNRNITELILVLIFLILPWTRINGHQTILFNIFSRQFIFFGVPFWAHDFPKMFLVFVITIFSLAFATAVWGRVWCGWACPQTVFIDGIYRRIEIWIEGNYLERRRLLKSAWDFNKTWRFSLKWILYFIISSLIAHSFAAYFVGSYELVEMVTHSPTQNWTYFLMISFLTATILFDFGWFREQFCIIMCPYGRFQGVLMDDRSLAVLYDAKRGEPRRGSIELKPDQKLGDCINCRRCVEVCPTGIDIRNGVQLECIACTACVDACDEIMTKVSKPKGLIRYNSVSGIKSGLTHKRPMLYLTLIIIFVSVLSGLLMSRKSLDIKALRGIGAPFEVSVNTDGESIVTNHFRLKIQNQEFNDLKLKLEAPENADYEFVFPENPFILKAGELREMHLFAKMKQKDFNQKSQAIRTIYLKEIEVIQKKDSNIIHLIEKKTPTEIKSHEIVLSLLSNGQ